MGWISIASLCFSLGGYAGRILFFISCILDRPYVSLSVRPYDLLLPTLSSCKLCTPTLELEPN